MLIHITYPANFQLIAAMNPLSLWFLGDEAQQCKKAPICGADYKNKISGPFLDRIDLVVNVGQIDVLLLQNMQAGEESKFVKQKE